MSASLKIMSNSTKHSGVEFLSVFSSEKDLPLLAEYGVQSGGIASIRAPYEMRRVGGSEKRHVALWLILEGTVRFEIPGSTFTARPGSTLVMTPDSDRICSVQTGIFRHIYFTLSPESSLISRVYDSLYAAELGSVLKMLFRELAEPASNRSASCREHLALLLADYIGRELRHSPDTSRLKQMFELVETKISFPWTTAALAKKMNMSPSLLYQLCRKLHGRSPRELIADIKFRFASELLRRTDDRLDAIANAVGYSSAFAFSKAFFKHTGKRPAQIREK